MLAELSDCRKDALKCSFFTLLTDKNGSKICGASKITPASRSVYRVVNYMIVCKCFFLLVALITFQRVKTNICKQQTMNAKYTKYSSRTSDYTENSLKMLNSCGFRSSTIDNVGRTNVPPFPLVSWSHFQIILSKLQGYGNHFVACEMCIHMIFVFMFYIKTILIIY